jgi:DNA-binding CsgD family transcriptional regulator
MSERRDVALARTLLTREADIPLHALARAYLLLFDATVAQRERRLQKATKTAKAAAEAFKSLGVPYHYARSLELCDMQNEALGVYRSIGAIRDLHRLTAAQLNGRHRGRAGTMLTQRENDIAQLVVSGFTNREIAFRLKISENTVEHHLDSIFNRLGIHSRSRLAALIAEQNAEVRHHDASPAQGML